MKRPQPKGSPAWREQAVDCKAKRAEPFRVQPLAVLAERTRLELAPSDVTEHRDSLDPAVSLAFAVLRDAISHLIVPQRSNSGPTLQLPPLHQVCPLRPCLVSRRGHGAAAQQGLMVGCGQRLPLSPFPRGNMQRANWAFRSTAGPSWPLPTTGTRDLGTLAPKMKRIHWKNGSFLMLRQACYAAFEVCYEERSRT